MWFGLVSLFPEMLSEALNYGVIGRAFKNGLCQTQYFNPRDYADNPNGYIDDAPYGGGAGMVMQPGPLFKAIEAARASAPGPSKVIYVSPQGRLFNQEGAASFLAPSAQNLIFIAGRYEGIDQRVVEHCVDEVWSIGDYVLSGGELPILVMMDAILRLVPGVVGENESVISDSFQNGLLEYPHYTRPAKYMGFAVPDVLQSGNHEAIRRWRLKESLRLTAKMRPDLVQKRHLNLEEQALFTELQAELKEKNR